VLTVRPERSRSTGFRLGPADHVTSVRAALVVILAALVLPDRSHLPVTLLVCLATVALVLDGVDGWVARRTGTETPFGARFDMEVDAFALLVLCVPVARHVGPWVMVIGLARYAFGAAGALRPWLRRTLPARYWRKPVTAVQGVALTIGLSGVLPPRSLDLLLLCAIALLSESFGRDVRWLWQRRTVPLVAPGWA
jgi:phosphatidylglycerophosphate synthase